MHRGLKAMSGHALPDLQAGRTRWAKGDTAAGMTAYDIIYEHYKRGSKAADILIRHSERVRDKALALSDQVPHLEPDTRFIAEAAMLHDIGVLETDSPVIGCHGRHPYLVHGVIGRKMLERYGWYAHALVCERHVGVGISVADVRSHGLPLPQRDMRPTTIEEMIICYADKFYSKTNGDQPHTLEAVVAGLKRYGADKATRFMDWHALLTGHGKGAISAAQRGGGHDNIH